MQIVTSPPKKIMYKFLLLTYFWQQLNFAQHCGWGVISNIGLNSRAQAK